METVVEGAGIAHNGISEYSKLITIFAIIAVLAGWALFRRSSGKQALVRFAIFAGTGLALFLVAVALPREVPVAKLEEHYGLQLEELVGFPYEEGKVLPTELQYGGEQLWLGMDRSTGKSVWTLYVGREGALREVVPNAI